MDLQLTAYCPADCTGTPSTIVPTYYELAVVDGSTQHTYFAHVETITPGFDATGYAEIRVNRANVYRYSLGDTLNGAAIADSQAMYEGIRAVLEGAIVVTTYYILAEDGKIINAENSDKIRTE